MLDTRLNQPWWILRLAFGLVPIVAGLDKFTNLLTHWEQYLSPLATAILPISATTFMHVVGVIEIWMLLPSMTCPPPWLVVGAGVQSSPRRDRGCYGWRRRGRGFTASPTSLTPALSQRERA